MNIDARVGVAVDGALNSSTAVHSSVVDAGYLILSQKQPQSHFGTVENLLAGGIAGAFSKTCAAPLARHTILFQLQGMQSEAAVLERKSVFVFESSLTELFRKPFVHFVSGGLSGITAASAAYPLDLVTTPLACTEKCNVLPGYWACFPYQMQSSWGVGPTLAINFVSYESLKSFWLSHRSDLLSSYKTPSHAYNVVATFPLDLVRRRMLAAGAGGRARVYKTGLFGTFKHIFKSEGIRGLYRGLLPEFYKVVSGVGITFKENALMSSSCPLEEL
ncbi:hypothetical protein Bca4012_017865 [Brassica carinata]|uniref:Mitochondrial carrier protein n=1 Tax=Brassica carinata TaxID=52824 RepID=A0A8X7WNC6_BRACI|nr:hypothetical protein Bca52824_003747 [Brassica carinata]